MRQELEHRRSPAQLSVFVRDRVGDQARQEDAPPPRSALYGDHTRVLAELRRRLRKSRLEAVVHLDLWKTGADADRSRGTRRGAGTLPARHGGDPGPVVSLPAEALLALGESALAEAGEAEVEIFLRTSQRGIARFAMGGLGQHMILDEPYATVRVAKGARIAEAGTSRLDQSGLVDAIAEAAQAARMAPEPAGFTGFAAENEPTGDSPPRFAPSTADASADERVDRLLPVMRAIGRAGLVSAGTLETRITTLAVTTTRGLSRSHASTLANFKVWALETPGAGGAAGYGGHTHRDVNALDLM